MWPKCPVFPLGHATVHDDHGHVLLPYGRPARYFIRWEVGSFVNLGMLGRTSIVVERGYCCVRTCPWRLSVVRGYGTSYNVVWSLVEKEAPYSPDIAGI